MSALTIGNRTISYEEWGTGPLAVLVHGSPGNGRTWARVAERLADRFRVIAPDLPGYGTTTPQPGESTVTYAAEMIEGLIANVGDPVVVAGHSYGGVVSLAVAVRARVRIPALVLFEPVAVSALAMAGDTDAYEKTKFVFTDYIATVERGHPDAIRTMVDFWFGAGAFDRLPPPVAASLTQAAPSNIRDVSATFRERYEAAVFRRLTIPITIVVGDRSPDVTHRIARALAAHASHATITPLAKGTHAMTTTHVDAVADLISNAAPARG